MNQNLPSDQAARDLAVRTFDRPVCVEAAAGTGKTTLMVERVKEIIRRGLARVDEVVAITFTEAAAAELRARIRGALEEAYHESKGDESERYRHALRDLDAAHVETIHAFCQSLLKERPIEAGIDPRFEVLDQLGMIVDFDAAWDDWFTQEVENDPAAVERVLLLDFDFKWIKKLAAALNRNRDMLPLRNLDDSPPDIAAYIGAVAAAASKLDALQEHCTNDDDRGVQQIDRISAYSAHLAEATGEDALRLIAMGETVKQLGNQSNWIDRSFCIEQKEICRELAAEQTRVREALRSYALGQLVSWLARFPTDYELRRRRSGKLDFDDLLVLTRRMLCDRKEVRRYFKENFKHLLVDEFQDTDPLQVEIVFFLAEESEGAADDWRQVRLDGGKLFVVGDPKQSIYRFRRADIATYNEARSIIEETNAYIPISQNFRCAPEIIDVTNDLFARRMEGKAGIQADYIPLVGLPERGARLAGPALAVLEAQEELPTGADNIRRIEANQVVALVRSILDSWQIEVTAAEGEGVEIRAVRAEDIAILIPARTGLEVFEEVFQDSGLVYSHEGGWSFYNRQEVQDLIAFLSAVDNPTDQRAVVATLRHIYGLSDDQLWTYRSDSNTLDYRDGSPDDLVERAFADLRRFHLQRNDRGLAVLVEEIVETTRLIEGALLKSSGQQAVANIYKFCELARQFQGQPAATLHRFVRWLRANRDATVREGDSALTMRSEDNLRVMTFHAAKGLEFPVVILANLSTRFGRANQDYVDRREQQIHFKRRRSTGNHTEFKTAGFDSVAALEEERERAEHVRALYVAMTRARDHLVISNYGERSGPDWLELFGNVLDGLPRAPLIALADKPEAVVLSPMLIADATPLLQQRQGWIEARETSLAGAPWLRIVTPSGGGEAELLVGEPPLPTPAGEGARLGILLHRLFELTDLRAWKEAEVREMAAIMAASDGLDGRAEELAEMALTTLRSDLVRRAGESGACWREVPFSLPLEGVLVEGSIDLLFEEGSALVVADLKSDRVDLSRVEEHALGYRDQAVIYAAACRRLTRRIPAEFVFYFARIGAEVRVSTDELRAGEESWLTQLQQASTA